MSRLARLGLRARLAIALVALAVLAVGIATLLSHQGVHPRLSEAAAARLNETADRVATVAGTVYVEEGGWTESGIHDLEHVALVNRLDLTLRDVDGRVVERTEPSGLSELEPQPGRSVTVPVMAGGKRVGSAVVVPIGGTLLTPEEVDLESSLDRLHLIAGAIAAAAALALAFVLAQGLSRPLRRIREAAQRISRGELETRVEPGGGPEMRAVGEALNRLASTLRREEELRRESVADLAHELRTPVSGLLSRIEAAQDNVLESEEANLDAMHEEALRLTRLFEDLTRLAEAEQPGLLLEKQPLDLAEVGLATAESFAPRFAERRIELSIELEQALVIGDPDRLGQVVSNLLSNALRYTSPSGKVRLRVAPEGRSSILEVSDNGIGIDPEDLDHIFDRFWRGEKSRSRETGGAGIGLAIVRELVRAHEGVIEVESTPKKGSCFRIAIPALRQDVAAGEARSTSDDLLVRRR